MSEPFFALWVYLSSTPLLWLSVTLIAYAVADRVSLATGRNPLANPVLHSVWIIAAILALSGTGYKTYFEGAQFVHFMLGPATVALAVPLYENRRAVVRALGPMVIALIAGSLTALASAVLIARWLGAPDAVVASIAPKSVTAGVAMGISEQAGGDAALTAVLVILTGIFCAIIVTPLMNLLGLRDWRARGLAAGLAGHGIATARAFQVNEVAGTFAAIALGLNAFLTALIVPLFSGFMK
ncbi:MAG: LrgB family protein [Alphaproteobacteria bacterium]|nr:LrgB family protein [Alphaproteobacteria bacterium]